MQADYSAQEITNDLVGSLFTRMDPEEEMAARLKAVDEECRRKWDEKAEEDEKYRFYKRKCGGR